MNFSKKSSFWTTVHLTCRQGSPKVWGMCLQNNLVMCLVVQLCLTRAGLLVLQHAEHFLLFGCCLPQCPAPPLCCSSHIPILPSMSEQRRLHQHSTYIGHLVEASTPLSVPDLVVSPGFSVLQIRWGGNGLSCIPPQHLHSFTRICLISCCPPSPHPYNNFQLLISRHCPYLFSYFLSWFAACQVAVCLFHLQFPPTFRGLFTFEE